MKTWAGRECGEKETRETNGVLENFGLCRLRNLVGICTQVISCDLTAFIAHFGASSLVYFTGSVSVLAGNHFILNSMIEWSHDTFLKAIITSGF